MRLNATDLRIKKWLSKGIKPERIATRLGYGDPPRQEGLDRVKLAQERIKENAES